MHVFIYATFYVVLGAVFVGIDRLTSSTGKNAVIVGIIACLLAYTLGKRLAYMGTKVLVLLAALSPTFVRIITEGQITDGMLWSVSLTVFFFFSIATAAPSVDFRKKYKYE